MNKLKFYGLKDDVTGNFVFTFMSENDGTMKRVVKSALLGKEPNVFTRDLKDKKIYDLGNFDTDTGKVSNNDVVYIASVAEIRLELIREIKVAKQEAGEEEDLPYPLVKPDGVIYGSYRDEQEFSEAYASLVGRLVNREQIISFFYNTSNRNAII